MQKRKCTINPRVQKILDMEQLHHFGTVFGKEDRETGKVVQKPRLFIAKFHYTDTDTGPTRTKSAHVVWYELNSTTRARHGPDRDRDTDTDFFVAKLRWVRAGPFRRKKVRVRVRVGPVSV